MSIFGAAEIFASNFGMSIFGAAGASNFGMSIFGALISTQASNLGAENGTGFLLLRTSCAIHLRSRIKFGHIKLGRFDLGRVDGVEAN